MATWAEFQRERPDLAAEGRAYFYEFGGIGLGFLATVRADGGPRVHPICPILTDDALYALIIPGPKLNDLRRDGRYALHSETLPPPRHDDGFYVTGTVREIEDGATWDRVVAQFLAERNQPNQPTEWPGLEEQVLFELHIARCLLMLTSADRGFPAGATVWHASRDAGD